MREGGIFFFQKLEKKIFDGGEPKNQYQDYFFLLLYIFRSILTLVVGTNRI